MDYIETLKRIDEKIEFYITDLLENNIHRSVKAEEYLRTFCMARDYINSKISTSGYTTIINNNSFNELCKLNAEMVQAEFEAENEG